MIEQKRTLAKLMAEIEEVEADIEAKKDTIQYYLDLLEKLQKKLEPLKEEAVERLRDKLNELSEPTYDRT